jgi:hypothetical protein
MTTQGQGSGSAVQLNCIASGFLHYDSQQEIFIAQCAIEPPASKASSIAGDHYSLRFFKHGELLNSYSDVAPGLVSCGIADEKTAICIRSRERVEVLKFDLHEPSPPDIIADLEPGGIPDLVGMTSDGSAIIQTTEKERWVLTPIPGRASAQWISDRPVHTALRTDRSLMLFSIEPNALWGCSIDQQPYGGVHDLTSCWIRVWTSTLGETPIPLGLHSNSELWVQDGDRIVSVLLQPQASGSSPSLVSRIYNVQTDGVATFSGSARCLILQTRAVGVACLSFAEGGVKASLLRKSKGVYLAFGDDRMASAYLVMRNGEVAYLNP